MKVTRNYFLYGDNPHSANYKTLLFGGYENVLNIVSARTRLGTLVCMNTIRYSQYSIHEMEMFRSPLHKSDNFLFISARCKHFIIGSCGQVI